MKVDVTQEHIDCGKPLEPLYCPVALAIDEQAHKVVIVNYWKLAAADDSFSSPTPVVVRRFVERFDRGLSVKPFSFELEFPL